MGQSAYSFAYVAGFTLLVFGEDVCIYIPPGHQSVASFSCDEFGCGIKVAAQNEMGWGPSYFGEDFMND